MTAATVAVPYLVYSLLTLYLADWLIDDAGITFSYARNFAMGHGLVAQPGVPPVEGYSNFLWLLIYVPWFLIRVFDPYLVPKIVSLVIMAGTYWLMHLTFMRLLDNRRIVSFTILLLVSVNTPWVVWTCSGLENPLLAFLVFALALTLLKALDQPAANNRLALTAGLLAGAIGLTRPDGIVYAWLFPAAILFVSIRGFREKLSELARSIGLYALGFLVTYGSYLVFRLSYFGEWVPNTYYVKPTSPPGALWQIITLQGKYLPKFAGLCGSVLVSSVWLIIPVFMVLLVAVVLLEPTRRRWLLPLGLTISSLAAYMIMPPDWMGEYRFATIFFPSVLAVVVLTIYALARRYWPTRGVMLATVLSLAVILPIELFGQWPRLQSFARTRVTDFNRVKRAGPDKFEAWVRYLNLDDASILTPDLGATLYYSSLRVYDLAGLCDPVIPRTRGKDQKKFYDYVFEEIRPTIINTWGSFTGISKFDDDPRFLEYYEGINPYHDEYVERVYRANRISGVFVRRDILVGREGKIDSLKQGLAP